MLLEGVCDSAGAVLLLPAAVRHVPVREHDAGAARAARDVRARAALRLPAGLPHAEGRLRVPLRRRAASQGDPDNIYGNYSSRITYKKS